MVKRWKEVDEVIKATIEVPKELWQLEEQMREIPNFNKTDGAKKIFQRKEYSIYKAKDGYIIHNTNGDFRKHHTHVVYNVEKPFATGHSHIYGFEMAKTIIDNCIKKKMPKTRNLYLLSSHARVSNDEKYIRLVEELIEVRKSKDINKYRNRSK